MRRRVLKIKPTPILRTITYGVFEAGCLELGVSPDEILEGTASPDTSLPSVAHGQRFLNVVLENGFEYDLASMRPDIGRAFFAHVRSAFFLDSRKKYRMWKPSDLLSMIGWAYRSRSRWKNRPATS